MEYIQSLILEEIKWASSTTGGKTEVDWFNEWKN